MTGLVYAVAGYDGGVSDKSGSHNYLLHIHIYRNGSVVGGDYKRENISMTS